ncbi:lariat debranching enzyme [Anopheles aquasalis]|uniref:lariat debranching enzyme n=1 Tax=Anopheles aquasalis TaxID=42839 RepID=UPI00215ABBF4|nr:lariat debranching enzyme [Anopheles aquasalis]
MKIAIEGCAHGELEKIYDVIGSIEEEQNITIDLLICCGDFQSTRNLQDLQCMAVPQKHLDMCSFYKYYSGEKLAPILTLFIGGNHEASNYLQELPYGGWVAPNIYYLGYAGVVECNGVRIGGISGIFKGHDFLKGRFEFPPYTESTKRSVYHQRQIDVFRLKQLSHPVDIMLSHDWPRAITEHGNVNQLLRFKPAFREDIESNRLGSGPCEDLLQQLKPQYWFAAHLHCKFAALVEHKDGQQTKFLALDKCLPRRRFLQVLDIPTAEGESTEDQKMKLRYDLEWLTILNLTNHLISVRATNGYMPGQGGDGEERFNFTPTEEEKAKVLQCFDGNLTIPDNFVRISAPYQPSEDGDGHLNMSSIEQPQAYVNPQTTTICDRLNIDDPLRLAMLMTGHELNTSTYVDPGPVTVQTPASRKPNKRAMTNADELDVDDEEDEDDDDVKQDETLQTSGRTVPRTSLSSTLPQPRWCADAESQESDLSTTLNDSLASQATATPQKSLGDNSLSESLPVVNLNLSSPQQATDSGAVTDSGETVAKDGVVQETPPMKKFKRRNQTIYANEDD